MQKCLYTRLVYQLTTFKSVTLSRDAQPVKFVPQKLRQMVLPPPAADDSDCAVQDRRYVLHLAGREAGEKTVTVLQ